VALDPKPTVAVIVVAARRCAMVVHEQAAAGDAAMKLAIVSCAARALGAGSPSRRAARDS
jgi:hypothetical protein